MFRQIRYGFVMFWLMLFSPFSQIFSQSVNIKIYVDFVEVTRSRDCDIVFGNSDFGFEFRVLHGWRTNNFPNTILLDDGNYFAYDGNDGPYKIDSPDNRFHPSNALIFDYMYSCTTIYPDIQLNWIAYESDDIDIPPNNEGDVEGKVRWSVPWLFVDFPDTDGITNHTYSAISADSDCDQEYRISFRIERTSDDLGVSAHASNTSICLGEQVTLYGSGASSYSWNHGVINNVAFEPTISRTYTVTGNTANGCMGSDSITIVVNPNPLISTTVIDQTSCTSDDGEVSATADGTTSGYTFEWWNGNTADGDPDHTGAMYSDIPAGEYTVRATNSTTLCSSTELVNVGDQTIDPQITTSTITDNTSCNPFNGEVTITAISPGVVDDYTFDWYLGDNTDPGNLIEGQTSATIAEIGPGSYTMVAIHKANNCSSMPSLFEISDLSDSPVIVTSSTDQTSCTSDDGEVSATADGTTSGYTFEWWNGNTTNDDPDHTGAVYSNISPGEYTVRATNSTTLCSSTELVNVGDQTIDPQITASVVTDNTNCDPFNGEITITAISPGVVDDYTFDWYLGDNTEPGNLIEGQTSATITEMEPGYYTTVATHSTSGCSTAPSLFEISDVSGLPVIVTSIRHQTSCTSDNGEVSATVDGTTSGYSFEWWKGNTTNGDPDHMDAMYSGIPAGEYTVRATNSTTLCSSTELVNVGDQTIAPQITTSVVTDNTNCDPYNGEITISAISPGIVDDYTFDWYLGDNTDPGNLIEGLTGANIVGIGPGSYTVVATHNASGCSSTSSLFKVKGDCPTGLTDLDDPSAIDLKAIPNPSSQHFSVDFINDNHSQFTMTVFDSQGRLIFREKGNQNSVTISHSSIPSSGIYILYLKLDQKVYSIRLIRQ